MWTAMGEALPFAIGLALSPFAIVTGIVLLLGAQGRLKCAAFGIGWFAALLALTGVALFIVDSAEAVSEEYTETGVDVVQLVFAVLFLLLAVLTWRKRSRQAGTDPDSDDAKPSLLSRLDDLSVPAALGVGVLQGLVVIKNIPLALSGGAVFGEAALSGWSATIAVVTFALVASLGVLVPFCVAVVGGARLRPALTSARAWIETNMSAITLTVLLVLGALFLGQGLGVLD